MIIKQKTGTTLKTASQTADRVPDRRRHDWTLTSDGELGVGDVRTADHAVVALIFHLAVLDLQIMAVTHAADVILVAVVQFLCALVPGQSDLWVIDSDLTLERGGLVLCTDLVTDVLDHRNRLRTKYYI